MFCEEIWYPSPDPCAEPKYFSYDEYQSHVRAGGVETQKVRGRLLKHRSTIFYNDWFDLYGQPADILVTHEAAGDHEYGFSVLNNLAQSMKAKYLFHGHVHSHGKSMAGRVEVHSVGFRAVTDQYGGMVSAGGQITRG